MKTQSLRTKCQFQLAFRTQFKKELKNPNSNNHSLLIKSQVFNRLINNKKINKKLNNLNGSKLQSSASNVTEPAKISKIRPNVRNVMVKEPYTQLK